jgi:subtilisin family serine protease
MIVTSSYPNFPAVPTLSFQLLPERRCVRLFAAVRVLNCIWLAQFSGFAQNSNAFPLSVSVPTYRADRILVQPKAPISPVALTRLHSAMKVEVLRTFEGIGHLQVLRVPDGETVPGLITRYQQSGLVEFAEPDFLVQAATTTPNDPKYLDGTLWGLNNIGQNGGTADADIDAPETWDVLTSASNIVVAVLDTGVRYTHEDLAANMWVNPSDGGHGFNALTGTNNPNDDNGHGTLMAGIIGAVGDNGLGVVGVAWGVQIMAAKCLDSTGNGSDSDLISCIDYARTNGARIINASLDSAAYSQSLSNAIHSARNAGIIFVASCGNGPPSRNVDLTPRYPSCYTIDNIVSVAYTDRNDALGFLSNYGATNVDLAAPGDQVYSTYANSDTSYYPPSFLNVAGTSYAAAYVTGAFALVLARYPAETYQQIIARVLNGTDPLPALTGKCVTGGRLNLRKALSPPISLTIVPSAFDVPFQVRVSAGPNRTCVVESSSNLTAWSSVFTNTTSATGTFDFIDNQPASSAPRFFRAVSNP